MKMNHHYGELKASYLFVDIAHKVAAYQEAHPEKEIIRLGIGDVTQPLAKCVVTAMQDAAAEMGTKEGFHGYGPEQGYPFLKQAIQGYYAGRGTRLDLSMADEMEYYNGLVFTGYVAGIPCAVLKGGRYDYLMQRFTPGANAIGFAIYLDELERLAAPLPPVQQQGREKSWLNIALPKGRLGDKAYKLLAGAGYSATEDYNDTRKLVVENPDACVRYFLVKPSDVAIYVEHGAADIGIVGKDILTESGADVYELLDTGMGKCRMCVAGPAGFTDDESRALRVATKFVTIARDHYERRGRDIDIVKLNGSIELAPILGLSDVIVDIVETGTTLKENDLTVIEEFMPISARFIANKASYKFKYAQLTELLNKMKEALAK